MTRVVIVENMANMKARLVGVARLSALAGLLAFATACAGIGDSAATNDCLIVAARAQFALPSATWSRLLVVRYGAASLQHVYLVYDGTDGMLHSFDSVRGEQRFRTADRSATGLARVVDPLSRSGWYIEDNAGNRHLAAN